MSGTTVKEKGLCDVCGAPIPRGRLRTYCSSSCMQEGREQKLLQYRIRRAAKNGRTYQVRGLRPDPDECQGKQLCASSLCHRYVTPEERICPDCMPRFEGGRPARATEEELELATRGGQTALAEATQLADPGVTEAYEALRKRGGGQAVRALWGRQGYQPGRTA